MRSDLLEYDLPQDLIAQRPAPSRDGARLLVLDGVAVRHRRFVDWVQLVPAGALVVLNDTKVRRARLVGRRAGTGGRVELLLLRRLGGTECRRAERWSALGRASGPLRPGTVVECEGLRVRILERADDGGLHVEASAAGRPVEDVLEEVGHVPLPPYVRRPDDAEDARRYQTVYARRAGAVAAPTAGLHLTSGLLAALEARGVEVGRVTLHVGPGTFRPVCADDLDDHPMHAEHFEVPAPLAASVAAARMRSAPVVAVGTTVVRALESAADPSRAGHVLASKGETDLLIQPGHRFSIVDGLLTNFHMPRSTLLALVAAFAGLDRVLAAYREAREARYRFLSYGDAMWIPERGP